MRRPGWFTATSSRPTCWSIARGVVKILDLGLARFFHDKKESLTQKYDGNAVLGTADYLAPEQAVDSHNVDIRCDIYSLGITFYFLLAGHSPFQEGSVAEKLIWHQVRQPKPIREVRPEMPEGMADVLEKMIAKEPAQRYQTPAEVAEALAPWTQDAHRPAVGRRTSRRSPRRPAAPASATVNYTAPGRRRRSTPTPRRSNPHPTAPAGPVDRAAVCRGVTNTQRTASRPPIPSPATMKGVLDALLLRGAKAHPELPNAAAGPPAGFPGLAVAAVAVIVLLAWPGPGRRRRS